MASRIARNTRRDRGAEAVEFALISVPLLLLIGAIVQLSVLFWMQTTLTQAAREGARLAAICNQDSACLATVKQRTIDAGPGLHLTIDQIDITQCPATSSTPPADAIITISYVDNLGGPISALKMNLTGRAHMPCGG